MTNIKILYDPALQGSRWLGYFDLLGTQERIEAGKYFDVFDIYARAVEAVAKSIPGESTVCYVCFSDSFIVYSPSDSGGDFQFIDHVARWFTYNLISNYIPVRGALSCGGFYADKTNNIYFGPALNEAYKYGEAQDWVGFLLAPSA